METEPHLTHCCEYHSTPVVFTGPRIIRLPQYVMFHAPNGGRVYAILFGMMEGTVLFRDETRTTTSWWGACQRAMQFCEDTTCITMENPLSFWYMRFMNEEHPISFLDRYTFIQSRDITLRQKFSLCSKIENPQSNAHAVVQPVLPTLKSRHNPRINSVARNKKPKLVVPVIVNSPVIHTPPCTASSTSVILETPQEITDSEVEEDVELFGWTPENVFWDRTRLEVYLCKFPHQVPNLLRILSCYKCPWHRKSNAIYSCVFQHPTSCRDMECMVAGPILANVPQYDAMLTSFKTMEPAL